MPSTKETLKLILQILTDVHEVFDHLDIVKHSDFKCHDEPEESTDVYILNETKFNFITRIIGQACKLLQECLPQQRKGSRDENGQFKKKASELDEDENIDSSNSDLNIKLEEHAEAEDFQIDDRIESDDEISKPNCNIQNRKTKQKQRKIITSELSPNNRHNLICLLKWICSLSSDEISSTSFDVLKGKSQTFYGLSGSKNKWRKELTFLLLKCPNFNEKSNPLFFARIFKNQVNAWKSRLAVYQAFLSGSNRYLEKQKKFCGSTPLITELLKTGFGPFQADADLSFEHIEDNVETKDATMSCSDLEAKDSMSCSGHEAKYSMSGFHHGTKAEGSEGHLNRGETLMSFVDGKVFNVRLHGKAFAARDLYHFKRVIISEMKAHQAFALVGLEIPKTNENSSPIEGRILVQSSDFESSDPDAEFEAMLQVLMEAFSVSEMDMFKTTEVLPKDLKKKYYKKFSTKERRKIETLTKVECQEMLDKWREKADQCRMRKDPNIIGQLPCENNSDLCMSLRINSKLSFERINNLALLMGDCPTRISIRSLLTNESLQKFLSNEVMSSYLDRTQNYSMHQLSRAFLEIFRTLTLLHLPSMCLQLKTFGGKFKSVREILSWEHLLDEHLNHQTEKQCQNCGKVFQVSKNSYKMNEIQKHIKECELERSTCSCQISFKSPADKRRHMLLIHSGQSYLECNQCSFITKNNSALTNHVQYTHGLPGREEVCDLCFKPFKSKYHLQIHRFNHEKYLCTVCWLEILGRSTWNNHLKKVHGAGKACQVCGKVFANQVEVNHHVKMQHSQKVWAT